MKSSKRSSPKKFRPFSKPDIKVLEVWSRWATTLSASAFAAAFIVITTESFNVFTVVKTVALVVISAIMMLCAIYAFKGVQDE